MRVFSVASCSRLDPPLSSQTPLAHSLPGEGGRAAFLFSLRLLQVIIYNACVIDIRACNVCICRGTAALIPVSPSPTSKGRGGSQYIDRHLRAYLLPNPPHSVPLSDKKVTIFLPSWLARVVTALTREQSRHSRAERDTWTLPVFRDTWNLYGHRPTSGVLAKQLLQAK